MGKTVQAASVSPSRQTAPSRGMSRYMHDILKEDPGYLIHWAPPERVSQIMKEGIVPWDEGPGHVWDSWVTPRPGHTYMMGEIPDDDFYEGPAAPGGCVALKIDLSYLKAENLVADEDYAAREAASLISTENENEGLPENPEEGESPHGTLGAWAEANSEFVDDADMAWDCLENFNTLAHRGAIPPEAITVTSKRSGS